MRFLPVIAAVLAMGGAARAGTISAADPQALTGFLTEQGVPARLETDSYGDPLIRLRYLRTSYEIFFYGCTDNRDCRSLQFSSGYDTEGAIGVNQANAWNIENRFTFSYVTEDNTVRLEYDVFTGAYGIDDRDFADILSLWHSQLEDFEEFINW